MKSVIFILFALLLFSASTIAQIKSSGALSGKIIDKSSNQPLEYATITVISNETGKIINGAVTGTNGTFEISNIPLGTYQIKIEFIGYEKVILDSIHLNINKQSVSLGTILISSSAINLQGVTITGNKTVIENRIDKTVYNVSSDLTSQGGLAIDVLKKVPQVTVDIDGNVELQGNSNIRFLINGMPSSVFGNNVADALASIPASQIKNIETITNPGAKYESQGTGGIINIILQDNKMQGVSGTINLSAGTRLEIGSANFNIRHNKIAMNFYFSGNAQLKSKMPFSQHRITNDTTTKEIITLLQDGNADFERNGIRSGIGFDWNLTKNDNITGSLSYNQFSNRNQGPTFQEELINSYSNNPLSDISTLRNSDNHSKISSIDWSLDYKKKFKKEGQELDILYDASNGRPITKYLQTQSYSGQPVPYMGSTSNNPGTNNETEVSIDYSHPLNENFIVETGVKTTIQKITSNANVDVFNPSYDQFLIDPLQSYSLKYAMKVYAGYLSTDFPLFHYLKIKAGARYEYTEVNIDYPNTSIPSYGTFVPSVIIAHSFNKNQSVKLAYSKRIERPDYRELNPFVNLSDPYNIVTGNPLLKPEIGNNFELGYNSLFKKGGNLYIAFIERINTHDIKQMTVFYPTYLIGDSTYENVSVVGGQNIGSEYNSGISASGTYSITSQLNLRGNLMLTYRYVISNLSIGNTSEGIRLRLNLNMTYQLSDNLVLELFGNYSAPTRNVQGKVPQFFIYTFAFRKMFWNHNASFGFTTTNPFNKYVRQVTTITSENTISSSFRQMPLRSFGISFTYRFGKMEFKKNKEENDNNSILEDINHN